MILDGSFQDFNDADYLDYIAEWSAEHVEPISYGKFPYAKCWGQVSSMDIDKPKGIYRSSCLARLNAYDYISLPLAQTEL